MGGQWANGLPLSNDALHEDIKKSVDNGVCTKTVTATRSYCQFLYKYDSNDKFVCQSCYNTCYSSADVKRCWTLGLNICDCPCKNN